MRRALIVAACVAAIGAVACQTQGFCESTPPSIEYCTGSANDVVPCQGHIIDSTHWESGPQSGNFLSFGASQTYHLNFRDAKTGQILSGQLANAMIQVGSVQDPNVGGGSWIICSVGLCNVTALDPTSLYVQNGTCSPYFFRVVVTLIPPSDAGTE